MANCKPIVPKRGGRIELSINQSDYCFDKFDKLTSNGNNLIFENIQAIKTIANHQISNTRIRYRGPLEIGLLQEMGKLMHLPWYCEADFSIKESDLYLGREFISPISVASNDRVSSEAKGANFRLHPLGYSLLEFDNDCVLAILQNIFNDKSINYSHLHDIRRLLWEFPTSNQKLAKNQKTVTTFRSNQENKLLRKIKSKEFSIDDLPLINNSAVSNVELGSISCKWLALIRALKEFASPCNKLVLPKILQKYLVNLNLIDQNNYLLSSFIVERIGSVISVTMSLLNSVGFNSIYARKLLKEFDKRAKEVEDKVLIPLNSSSLDHWQTSIGILIPVLRQSTDFYYQFVSFICANIFKASLFQTYFLLGSKDYIKFIEYILDERSSKKFINYRPILW